MLEDFLEDIVDGDKESLKTGHKAYRMDGEPDLRKKAGLNTCSCCDYFIASEEVVFLIEVTRLVASIETYKEEVGYLNEDHKEDYATKKILMENRIKTYGGMLVLCRLANKYSDFKTLMHQKKYCFWLVINGLVSNEDKRYMDELKGRLENALKGQLGPEVVDDVKIFPAAQLEVQISEHVPSVN